MALPADHLPRRPASTLPCCRARSEETGVPQEYLEQLHQHHEDWLNSPDLYRGGASGLGGLLDWGLSSPNGSGLRGGQPGARGGYHAVGFSRAEGGGYVGRTGGWVVCGCAGAGLGTRGASRRRAGRPALLRCALGIQACCMRGPMPCLEPLSRPASTRKATI